jgi:hypothetical protein
VKLSVHFRLIGTGWAECQIADETSSCTVTASYLSDALRHLLLAATAVVSEFRRVTFKFDEEPGEFRWVISSSLSEIDITILEFRQLSGDSPDTQGAVRFRTVCRPRTFAEAVCNAATGVLSTLGESGYAEKWSAFPFPMLQYQELRRVLEAWRGA